MNGYPYPVFPTPQRPESDDLRVALPIMVRTLQGILQTLQGQRGGGPDAIKHGWSQSGTMKIADSRNTVGLQVQFDEEDVYTVQVGVTPPTYPEGYGVPVGEAAPYWAKVGITWKVNGVYIYREMDLGNGASMSAPAEAVEVRIIDYTPARYPAAHPSAGIFYPVTITVSRGVRASTVRPMLTATDVNGNIGMVDIAGGGAGENQWLIPNIGVVGAQICMISAKVPMVQTSVYAGVTSAGNAIMAFQPVPGDNEPVYFPGNADTLSIVNQDPTAADDIYVTVRWLIDG